MARKRNRAAETAGTCSTGKILFGGFAGLFLTLLLTFSAALAISHEVMPITYSAWLGPVIIVLSAFLAAWLSARRNGKKLLCGLLAAILYGSAMMVCGMLLFSSPMKFGRLLLSAGALLLGAFGGVVLSGLQE